MKKTIIILLVMLIFASCGQSANIAEYQEIEKILAEQNERAKQIEECAKMPDGINCIDEYEKKECKNVERYNAEIAKRAECREKIK